MKILLDAPQSDTQSEPVVSMKLHLPFGLIGLRQLTHFELESLQDGMPFQTLRSMGEDAIEFVVAEGSMLVDSYTIVLRDEDTEPLGIRSPEDALILNIVAIHSHDPQHVTVNLVGPLVVNRSTGIGSQVIISNSSDYSSEHVLVDERAPSPAENSSQESP
jgi:flagellar assembly factor FliW